MLLFLTTNLIILFHMKMISLKNCTSSHLDDLYIFLKKYLRIRIFNIHLLYKLKLYNQM